MMRKLNRPTSNEDGVVLIMALVFTIVFALILGALFTNASANLRNTTTVRNNEDKAYAADGGIDWGLQQVRNNDTLCPNTLVGTKTLENPPSIGGLTPTVTCQVISGSVSGFGGWAVVTAGNTFPSFETLGPQTFEKTITGPVWSSGISNSLDPVQVEDGDVYEQSGPSTCTASSPAPNNLTFTPSPPFGYHCDTSRTINDIVATIPHVQPGLAFGPSATAQPADGDGATSACRVFSPGKYTSLDLLSHGDNYFKSGVYYFQDVTINIDSTALVGGMPAADETESLTSGCSTDSGNGTGVKFILGGSSKINIGQHGFLTLYSRDDNDDPSSEGTENISIQTVESDWSNSSSSASPPAGTWKVSSLGLTDRIIDVSNGNTPQMLVYGGVYVRNARIFINPTNSAVAWLRGGLLTGSLQFRQEATISGVLFSIKTSTEARQVKIVSKVVGASGRQLVSTAIANITNDEGRTLTLSSWRTSCLLSDGMTACPNV
jgi:hypothetical protein